MRKIKTMADIERTRRRNNIILGLIMVFLLTVSSLGYSLMSADNKNKNAVSENGFDFFRDGALWKVKVGNNVFGFQNLPSEVGNIENNLSVEFNMYSGKPLYFVNIGEGLNEILGNLGPYILRYQEACLTSDVGGLGNETIDCVGDFPIKNCDSNLIIFMSGYANETMVYSEGNCVFIVGDAVLGSDAFLYKVLGVI